LAQQDAQYTMPRRHRHQVEQNPGDHIVAVIFAIIELKRIV